VIYAPDLLLPEVIVPETYATDLLIFTARLLITYFHTGNKKNASISKACKVTS